jgi:hypothetical protein
MAEEFDGGPGRGARGVGAGRARGRYEGKERVVQV